MNRKTVGLADEVFDYVIKTSLRDDDILRRLREETGALEFGMMQIAPDQGQFMALLATMTGACRAIEVGTFTGYSALCIARALGDDGKLVACDVSNEWTGIARRYWKEAGVAERIDLHIAPALETLETLVAQGNAGSFDIAFIDADKENYDNYYERCLVLVRKGGLILIDNVLWGGSVADDSDQNDSTVAIRKLNAKIGCDERVDVAMVPIGDGLTIARIR